MLVERISECDIVKIFQNKYLSVTTIYRPAQDCSEEIPCLKLSKKLTPQNVALQKMIIAADTTFKNAQKIYSKICSDQVLSWHLKHYNLTNQIMCEEFVKKQLKQNVLCILVSFKRVSGLLIRTNILLLICFSLKTVVTALRKYTYFLL